MQYKRIFKSLLSNKVIRVGYALITTNCGHNIRNLSTMTFIESPYLCMCKTKRIAMYIENVNSPADVKKLSIGQLEQLAQPLLYA